MSREFDLQTWREDRSAVRRFEDEERNGVADPGRDSNPLADLLVFLSDGFHTGTLLARALAFLWVLRPDLVKAEGGAASVDAVALKAGLSRAQLHSAVRQLRTTAPELDQAMRNVRTSRARFLALAEIKARRRVIALKDDQAAAEARAVRRKLALQDEEAMAEARRALAHERVRESKKRYRDKVMEKRLRVARQVLAMADPLIEAAAEDMRAFDRSMGLIK